MSRSGSTVMKTGCTNSPACPSLIHGKCHLQQVGRADVRAKGEAEIDQHQLAAEVRVGSARAVLIGEGERAADRLAVPHHRVHQLGGGTLRLLRR